MSDIPTQSRCNFSIDPEMVEMLPGSNNIATDMSKYALHKVPRSILHNATLIQNPTSAARCNPFGKTYEQEANQIHLSKEV